MWRFARRLGLRGDRDAAVDRGDACRSRAGAIVLELGGDLRGELARRDEDERGRTRVSLGSRRSTIGIAKASVLPEPVGDFASTSRPASASGRTSAWIRKGAWMSRSRKSLRDARGHAQLEERLHIGFRLLRYRSRLACLDRLHPCRENRRRTNLTGRHSAVRAHTVAVALDRWRPSVQVEDRERVRDRVLELAAADERVVAGAVVGSLAVVDGDRWSDLDLTFARRGRRPGGGRARRLDADLVDEFDAVQLFDLPSGASIYRVFLLPGCLQFDLSFTPASAFGAGGPKFRLLFGEAVERPFAEPPPAHELFGYAVHHALRGALQHRTRPRLAGGVLDRRAARPRARPRVPAPRPARHATAGASTTCRPTCATLRGRAGALGGARRAAARARRVAIDGLLREADEVRELAAKVEPQLRTLAATWSRSAA